MQRVQRRPVLALVALALVDDRGLGPLQSLGLLSWGQSPACFFLGGSRLLLGCSLWGRGPLVSPAGGAGLLVSTVGGAGRLDATMGGVGAVLASSSATSSRPSRSSSGLSRVVLLRRSTEKRLKKYTCPARPASMSSCPAASESIFACMLNRVHESLQKPRH